MMYASTKDFFKSHLDGLSLEFQASDLDEVSEQARARLVLGALSQGRVWGWGSSGWSFRRLTWKKSRSTYTRWLVDSFMDRRQRCSSASVRCRPSRRAARRPPPAAWQASLTLQRDAGLFTACCRRWVMLCARSSAAERRGTVLRLVRLASAARQRRAPEATADSPCTPRASPLHLALHADSLLLHLTAL